MELPKIISDLLTAQKNFDSNAYAICFSETALIFDEGKTHKGQEAVKKWNEKTNKDYKTILEPIEIFNRWQSKYPDNKSYRDI